MKPGIDVDTSDFDKAMQDAMLTKREMLQIAGSGAKVQINGQKMRVPVKTAATETSIGSHIIEASETRVVDDIGPETEYAPPIEYGRRDMPGYPMQPFVRPTAKEDRSTTKNAMSETFKIVVEK
jgi:hypothetical protein